MELALGAIGYTGIYCARPTRTDGCAIIWKKDKYKLIYILNLANELFINGIFRFELAESKIVDYNILAEKNNDANLKQNCIGILALLRKKEVEKNESNLFCVATTRISIIILYCKSRKLIIKDIYWKPTFTEGKIRQVQLLLQEAHAFVNNYTNQKETKKPKTAQEINITETETTKKKIIKDNKSTTTTTTKTKTKTITTSTKTTILPEIPSIPIIICGDFNAAPNSGIYGFITSESGTTDFSSMTAKDAGRRLEGEEYHKYITFI